MRKTKQQRIDELELICNKVDKEKQQEAESKRKAISDNEAWVSGDKARRNEFAKAFGWTGVGFGSTKNEYPTWPEIFVHVGKLMNESKMVDMRHEINNLSGRLMTFEQDIFNLQTPKQ